MSKFRIRMPPNTAEYRKIKSHIYSWWEHKMAQFLWKIVWQFLLKLNILLPYDPEIMVFGIYPVKWH